MLISSMYIYMRQTLRTFYEDEKPALLQLIDAEFEKVGLLTAVPFHGQLTVSYTNECIAGR